MSRHSSKVVGMANAYRIWSWCNLHGWEHTTAEISEGVGLATQQVIAILNHKGWMDRVRRTTRDQNWFLSGSSATTIADNALEDLARG